MPKKRNIMSLYIINELIISYTHGSYSSNIGALGNESCIFYLSTVYYILSSKNSQGSASEWTVYFEDCL